MRINNKHFNCESCTSINCLLKLLTSDERQKIKDFSVSAVIKRGEVVFHQYTPVGYILHLKKGVFKTYVESSKTKRIILNIHKDGHFFGIRSFLNKVSYQFTAEAIIDSTICYINPEVFNDLLKENREFCYEILKNISQESLDLSIKLHSFMKSLLPGKVANTILYLSEEIYKDTTFDFPFSKTEFSQLIGASRERVSKVLSEFIHDKIVSFDQNQIVIESPELLERLSRLG